MIEFYPAITTNNITAEDSTWASMRQPYIFRFIRKDATYTNLVAPAGFISLTGLTIANYTPVAGDTLTIVPNNANPRIKAVGKIVSYAGGILTTDIPYDPNGVTTAGYILWGAWERYRIVASLIANIPFYGLFTNFNIGTIYGTPDTFGELRMDVSRLLTYMCQKKNLNTFTSNNIQDPHGWIRFSMVYGDNFYYQKNITQSEKVVVDGPFYAIDGVKQLMSVYGQNYCNYLPAINAVAEYPAKWLTMFVEPTWFDGYPFSLSFILRSPSDDHVLLSDQYDQQDVQQFIAFTPITYYEGLNQVTPEPPNALVDYMFITMNYGASGQISTPSTYYDDELPSEPRRFKKNIWGRQVSRTIRVNIDKECKKYPIYVMWKNSIGGWDYWLFDKVNERQYQSERGEKYEPYVQSIEYTTFRSRNIQAEAKNKIVVGDIVSTEVAEALSDIERSTAVFILHDARKLETTPEFAWMGVDIEPKGIAYKSNQQTVQVEFTLVLPEYYTVPS